MRRGLVDNREQCGLWCRHSDSKYFNNVPAPEVRSTDKIKPVGSSFGIHVQTDQLLPILSFAFFPDTELGSDQLGSDVGCETD